MRKKNEVFACFKDFHRAVQTQFGVVVKVLRSDNGIEYANITFRAYLSDQGIQYQTTCPYLCYSILIHLQYPVDELIHCVSLKIQRCG